MESCVVLHRDEWFVPNTIPICTRLHEHGTGSDYPPHTHPFFEFVYISQGFASHYYNSAASVLVSGDMFGMRPWDAHVFAQHYNTKVYNCLFYPEAIESEKDKISKLPGIDWMFKENGPSIWNRVHLNQIYRKEIINYLEKMEYEYNNRGTGWEAKIKGLLLEVLVTFSRAYEEQYVYYKKEKGDYVYTNSIYKAIGFIEEHYCSNIYIDQVAEYIGLNKDYFTKVFRDLTGLTPVEYINNIRMSRAAEFLLKTNTSIAGIAEKVGFDDPAYFSRLFKRTIGISPLEYQNKFGR